MAIIQNIDFSIHHVVILYIALQIILQISKHNDICIVLAYWDKGQVQPEYDPFAQTFLFKYFNGDLCQHGNETTSIAIYYNMFEQLTLF